MERGDRIPDLRHATRRIGDEPEFVAQIKRCQFIAPDVARRSVIPVKGSHRVQRALERTLHTMRSFDGNYGAARNIWCYELASLDLRNELGLVADATSCMPKIWDAVTSLHDRKY